MEPILNLFYRFFEKFFEDSVLVDTSFVQALDVDKLDPDDPLQRVAAQGRELPVAVLKRHMSYQLNDQGSCLELRY